MNSNSKNLNFNRFDPRFWIQDPNSNFKSNSFNGCAERNLGEHLILINSALRRVLYFSTSRNLSVLNYVTGISLLRQVNSPVNSTCCTFSERDLTHCHNIFFFGFLTGFNKRKNATYIFLDSKKNACNFSSDKFSLR